MNGHDRTGIMHETAALSCHLHDTAGTSHSRKIAVTKADIIDRIATGTGLTKIETEAVVNGFITTVMDALKDGDGIELRGFGSFRVQHRKARKARNPQTNEEMRIGPRYVPVFRPSSELRKDVDRAMKSAGSKTKKK